MSKIILFQGDSITDARRSRDADNFPGSGYPTMVKGELGLAHPGEYVFYNRGISGDRIPDVYARIQCDIFNLKPDYMSILIGVNDVWHEIDHQNGVSTKRFTKIYRMLLDDVLEELPDIKIMLLEPFVLEGTATCATADNPDRFKKFDEGVREKAAAVKQIAADYRLPFIALQEKFDNCLNLQPSSYWLMDGVHPTSIGHTVIKNEWVKMFNKIK